MTLGHIFISIVFSTLLIIAFVGWRTERINQDLDKIEKALEETAKERKP